MPKPSTNTNPVQTRDRVKKFIEDSEVDKTITDIRAKLGAAPDGKNMPALSDLIDEGGMQYVQYVQQGGGVLGVALVGYTYVLEKLGVRFIKIAGTSAGAINTLMLAAIDPENYLDENGNTLGYTIQSEAILHEMLSYNFWDLVDGSAFVKRVIRRYLSISDYTTRIMKNITAVIAIISVCSFAACLFYLPPFNNWLAHYPLLHLILQIAGILAITSFVFVGCVVCAGQRLLKGFAKSNYGVNTGNNFGQWMKDILARNKIHTTTDMEKKMTERTKKKLILRTDTHRPKSDHADDNTTEITGTRAKFITSDIINRTKVEFPDAAVNYWVHPENVNPADYVRASMSIPIFFQPLIVDIKDLIKEKGQELEDKELRTDVGEIYFVDGGTLSNFPINAFYNPDAVIPRMPTFGAKLEDAKHIDADKINSHKLKFSEFAGNILNTIRGYYDKDFIARNKIYKKGIAYIDVAGHNWLNFSINEKEQLELFKLGAAAATVFFGGGVIWDNGVKRHFNKFDWIAFRDARTQLKKKQIVKTTPATATPYSLSLSDIIQAKGANQSHAGSK